MRRFLTGIAAVAIVFPAVPVFAQYGGSPDQQIDELQQQDEVSKDDADVDADVDVDVDADYDADQEQALAPDEDPGTVEQGDSWQDEDGRTYCRRSDGTTGLIVGGGAGALVGRGIDRRGERGTGTIIGAIAGAIIGSAIERSSNANRCR